jgi:hypothetical protein
MSVVPLTVDGEHPTVVERKEDYRRDGHVILVIGLDGSQLVAANAANVSYDLRVGPEYRDHREHGKRSLEHSTDKIALGPGGALIIQTEETIYFPRGLYGIIAPKVSLL